MSGPAYLRLVGLGALIGVPAALVAVAFLALTHELEQWLWTDLPDALGRSSPPWYLIVGLPVVGACLVFAARRLLPGDGGHSPIGGLDMSPTPIAYGPGVALAALASLPFGAVLGPEAPLIALGSVVGLAVTRFARLDQREQKVAGMAGSFAAIAALFGGPIVAGMLLVEAGVGMGAALIPVLIPGLVAAAVGYVVFTGFGNWGGLEETVLTVPGLPAYESTRLLDLVLALGVGVGAALTIAGVHLLAKRVNRANSGSASGQARLLIAGALGVGLLALLADALGADSQDVLFSGQASLPNIIGEGAADIVLVTLVAKALAYGISLGCGFRGGPVFPAIFVGVGFTSLAIDVFNVSPTLAIAVGAAAGMTAATRLVLSSLVLAMLLAGTENSDVMPAAVLAAVAAWLTTRLLDARTAPAGEPGATAVPAS
jgi:H+/Cl- antiporter ClcA